MFFHRTNEPFLHNLALLRSFEGLFTGPEEWSPLGYALRTLADELGRRRIHAARCEQVQRDNPGVDPNSHEFGNLVLNEGLANPDISEHDARWTEANFATVREEALALFPEVREAREYLVTYWEKNKDSRSSPYAWSGVLPGREAQPPSPGLAVDGKTGKVHTVLIAKPGCTSGDVYAPGVVIAWDPALGVSSWERLSKGGVLMNTERIEEPPKVGRFYTVPQFPDWAHGHLVNRRLNPIQGPGFWQVMGIDPTWDDPLAMWDILRRGRSAQCPTRADILVAVRAENSPPTQVSPVETVPAAEPLSWTGFIEVYVVPPSGLNLFPVRDAVSNRKYTLTQYVMGEVEPEGVKAKPGEAFSFAESGADSHLFLTEKVASLARAAMAKYPRRVRLTVGMTANYQGGDHGRNPERTRPSKWEGVFFCQEQAPEAAHDGDLLVLVGGAADAYGYAQERGLTVLSYPTYEAALAALKNNVWRA